MISMTRTLLAMSVALAPVTLASAINRRVDVGKDINFDLKIWSTEKTDSMMPTHFARPDQNMTATSNAISYTAPDTPPDVKSPKDSQEDYFIIGQLHFNQVPGNTAEEGNPMRGPRKMYLYTGQQTPGQDAQGQKAVTVCTHPLTILLYGSGLIFSSAMSLSRTTRTSRTSTGSSEQETPSTARSLMVSTSSAVATAELSTRLMPSLWSPPPARMARLLPRPPRACQLPLLRRIK